MSDELQRDTAAGTLLGRQWLGLDEAGEFGFVRFAPSVDLSNRHGTIQGGFLAAMLDSATGLRAMAALAPGQNVVTVSLTTRFLAPARTLPLTARARIVERTDRDAVVHAVLADADGRDVAEADARVRVRERR